MNTTEPTNSRRMAEALLLIHDLHGGQRRKGPDDIPYITHLFGVAALVGEYGGNEDQIIAALLHDAAEDHGGEEILARIAGQFGEHVAGIVRACSDTLDAVKPPWRARKERHIAHVAAAPPEVKLIVAADKLYNAASLRRALRLYGPELWNDFKGGREGTLWYYGEMRHALAHKWLHPILHELDEHIEALGIETAINWKNSL